MARRIIRRPYGPGRWEGTDERLAAVFDNILGDGCVDTLGDLSEGRDFLARVPYSHRPGGYIVGIDTQGFHSAYRYATAESMAHDWTLAEQEDAEAYAEQEEP